MATKIRLQRHGRKKAPLYHIVVADINAPRDGKFIERIGLYNPTTVPAQITINVDKAVHWIQQGATPTATVNAILRYKGVLYKKHLLRGVSKGAFSMEEAENRFAEWVRTHEGKVMDHLKHIEQTKAEIKAAEVARISTKRLEKAAADAKKEAEEKAIAEKAAEETATKEENTTQEETAVETTQTEATNEEVTPEPTVENTEETTSENTDTNTTVE